MFPIRFDIVDIRKDQLLIVSRYNITAPAADTHRRKIMLFGSGFYYSTYDCLFVQYCCFTQTPAVRCYHSSRQSKLRHPKAIDIPSRRATGMRCSTHMHRQHLRHRAARGCVGPRTWRGDESSSTSSRDSRQHHRRIAYSSSAYLCCLARRRAIKGADQRDVLGIRTNTAGRG